MVCGSVCGHPNKIWRKLGGKRGGGWSCCNQGPDVRTWWPDVRGSWAGCPGSGSMDELDELRGEKSISGQNSGDFGDVNGRDDGGKARSTRGTTNPWIKSNKTSSHQ